MHWTALIEKKYFPAHARVIEDVACVGCGYNLRQARAAGPCPECGRPVSDSLWSLANPDVIASGLRSIGKSYLGLGALILVQLAVQGGACFAWAAALVVVTTAIIRAAGVGELRFRAEIDHLPVIGPRVRQLWPLALLDVALALVWSITLPMLQTPATGFGWLETIISVAFTAWLGTTFAVAGVAGWMGSALAAMLGYEAVARELRVQWMLIAAGPALAVAVTIAGLVLAGLFGVHAGDLALGAAVASLALPWLPAVLLTFTGMLHLASAAEREREALDDLVDAERTHEGFPRPSDEDLADIKMDQDPAP
jgi:hypothetical protein